MKKYAYKQNVIIPKHKIRKFKMKKLFILIAFILCLFNSNAQNDTLKKVIENTIEKSESIKQVENKLELVKEKSENHIQLMTFFLTIMGILLTLGFGASLYITIRNENRAKEVFEMYKVDKISQDSREDEIYKMFKTDKTNQDKRADEMYKLFIEDRKNEKSTLESTATTITLVRDTLQLAKDASDRSSKSLFKRLQNILDVIEKECKKIIKESEAFDDGKNLILRKFIQTEIHRVGNKIEGLENNLVILDADGENVLSLTPYSTFIKGADQYLKDQYEEALITWEKLTTQEIKGVDENLLCLTYYWIGYLNNNLANFKDGQVNFLKAETITTNQRKYELRRLQIETKFFNNENIESIIEELNALLQKIGNDTDLQNDTKKSIKSKVLNTLGNIYYTSSKETNDPLKKLESLNSSKKCFLEVLNITDDTNIISAIAKLEKDEKNTQKWVIYGLAETMFHISENKTSAIEIFKDEVIGLAELEYENREEKRTKVLAKTCLLLCHYRIDETNKQQFEKDKMMIDILLKDLDKNLTIYSQLERKNVKYTVFKENIKQIVDGKI